MAEADEWMLVDDALRLNFAGTEVDQNSEAQACRFQVGTQLLAKGIRQGRDRF
jgi:hypothetical protein